MNILQDIIICELHVKGWSAEVHLKPEDLGIPADKVSKAYKLGRKALIPDEIMQKFQTNESGARAILERNSFKFKLGTARALPPGMVQDTFPLIEDFITERILLAQDLITNYETYKAQMLPVYIEAAEIAFENLTPTGTIEFSIEGREADKKAFVDKFLERIAKLYPRVEDLANRFEMTLDVWPISIDFEKSDMISVQRSIEVVNARVRDELTQQAETTAKRNIDVEQYKAKTAERMSNYADDIVKMLRDQTVACMNEIADNIKNGQVIKGHTYNRLNNFIEKFKKMNVVGDTTVEAMLDNFKKEFLEVYPAKMLREDPELKEELSRRLLLISKSASEISDVSEITGEYSRKVLWNKKAAAA
jgi:hypothetical protein